MFHRHGLVKRWLEEIWAWMIKFKDAVFQIALEVRYVGPRLLAIKFLETCVLLFTPDCDSRGRITEAVTRRVRVFNILWLDGGHPVLDSVALQSEANRYFFILLGFLKLASGLPGSITVSVINSLATIGRRRQVHYSSVLSALLAFDANFMAKGAHNASIKYSLRTAFLGFLRSTHSVIMESREKLFRVLRAMNAGDAADQVMRQVDKMLRNSERASRASKDEQSSSHMLKRSTPMDEEHIVSSDSSSKRSCYGSNSNTSSVIQSDSGHNHTVNGAFTKVPVLDDGLTPVEQMIAMIGALLAEGERGAQSLEILISQIHPDLLADIVVTNMKHLPKNPPPSTRVSARQIGISSTSSHVAPTTQNPMLSSNAISMPFPTAAASVSLQLNAISMPFPTAAASVSLQADPKRDSRRDPRRPEPRRVTLPVGTPSEHNIMEDATCLAQSGLAESEDDASALSRRQPPPCVDNTSKTLIPEAENESHIPENITVSQEQIPDEQAMQVSDVDFDVASDVAVIPFDHANKDSDAEKSMNILVTDDDHLQSVVEADQVSPGSVDTPVLEENSVDLPLVPSYVELTVEQQKDLKKLAIQRIIDSYKQLGGTEFMQTRMALLSRLVVQVDADEDVINMIQKHIVSDYHHQKGHEILMHVLYHLHALMMSDSAEDSSVAIVYENFLLGVAKCLLDFLPANDKSFSRSFCEAPCLHESAFKLLDEICCSDNNFGKDIRDGDRVHQGLGCLWSLILVRPNNRQAFLDIALKCAVHTKDDIRTKAIRLVANKLYVISFISEKIEDFATKKLLSAVNRPVSDANRPVSDAELSVSGVNEQRTEGQIGSQETSISGSQISEPGTSEIDSAIGTQSDSQSDSSMSLAQAQQHLSLFFALCIKKPSLLQLVFDRYEHAPKAVKQAIHRHVPIIVRALGPSYSDLLNIISDPPKGSENLLTQVLHVLCEGNTPLADLVATVKRLYETKFKDATILIPILSSFTKNEVLPTFPRIVQLPLDKFQTALAHILQKIGVEALAHEEEDRLETTPLDLLFTLHRIQRGMTNSDSKSGRNESNGDSRLDARVEAQEKMLESIQQSMTAMSLQINQLNQMMALGNKNNGHGVNYGNEGDAGYNFSARLKKKSDNDIQQVKRKNQSEEVSNLSWSEFTKSLLEDDDLIMENKFPTQVGKVKDYYDSFNKIINQLQLSQEEALKFFIDGLQEDIKSNVKMYNPTKLHNAYGLAKLQEFTLEYVFRSKQPKESTMRDTVVESIKEKEQNGKDGIIGKKEIGSDQVFKKTCMESDFGTILTHMSDDSKNEAKRVENQFHKKRTDVGFKLQSVLQTTIKPSDLVKNDDDNMVGNSSFYKQNTKRFKEGFGNLEKGVEKNHKGYESGFIGA
ncbi:hypothetical protein SSX86_024818 [Deinandra increscens subsp. villosa]|uniref:Symplekin n=1 Tax=Deinandra increscens subsp. villosa TaxID=3103831 RepID=A0AAP0GMM6_9ASTR